MDELKFGMTRCAVVSVDVPNNAHWQEVTLVLKHQNGDLRYVAVPFRAISEAIKPETLLRRPARRSGPAGRKAR
jgi:hypothetical protein